MDPEETHEQAKLHTNINLSSEHYWGLGSCEMAKLPAVLLYTYQPVSKTDFFSKLYPVTMPSIY